MKLQTGSLRSSLPSFLPSPGFVRSIQDWLILHLHLVFPWKQSDRNYYICFTLEVAKRQQVIYITLNCLSYLKCIYFFLNTYLITNEARYSHSTKHIQQMVHSKKHVWFVMLIKLMQKASWDHFQLVRYLWHHAVGVILHLLW